MKKVMRVGNRVVGVVLGSLVTVSLVALLFGAEFSTRGLFAVLGALMLFVGFSIQERLDRIESLR